MTGSFAAGASSLTCNTAYHFAAYATNGYLSYGGDNTLTTSARPTSGGGGMIVGSGPPAPSAQGLPGYTPPRSQIDYPNGAIVYLGATHNLATMPEDRPKMSLRYMVIVTRHGRNRTWRWQIVRTPKPLGVKLYEDNFHSEQAARTLRQKGFALPSGKCDQRSARCLTKRRWEMKDVVEMLEAWEAD